MLISEAVGRVVGVALVSEGVATSSLVSELTPESFPSVEIVVNEREETITRPIPTFVLFNLP